MDKLVERATVVPGENNMDLKSVITALLSEMQRISSSETVVGQPVRVGDATIIPVSKLGLGFGTGVADARTRTGESSLGGGAAGGSISVEPQAFIVVDKNGQAQLLSLKVNKESALTRAIELLPQVVDKVIDATTGGVQKRLKEGESAPALIEGDSRHAKKK